MIECVPNFSEGRDKAKIDAIVAAVRAVDGVRVLDLQSDASHHRSVLTLAGEAEALQGGILALVDACITRIDLRSHQGEHPRLGAVDVVPFIPLEGASIADCVALARRTGEAIASRHHVPVFLYEEAQPRAHRKALEDIRRGQFEGLAEKIKDPAWAPDYGRAEIHASFGAVVVGARMPLIAFNVNLNTDDVEIAKAIAKAVRHSSGGFRFVKGMGVMQELPGGRRVAQVSMNMTDFSKTPLHRVFETIRSEAERRGVSILNSEIVGLTPQQALLDAAGHYLRLAGFSAGQILETRIRG
jgi:glutamate formiminotransferase